MIPENVFKLARFGPLKSNIRTGWFEEKATAETEQEIGKKRMRWLF